MNDPSYLKIIKDNLDWEKVGERLERYQYIAKFFPMNTLQSCVETPPYYCHYLGWRLGTWKNEKWFEFFDDLLMESVKLPGWNNGRIPRGCQFESFWSFIWELQTAVFFSKMLAIRTEWQKNGPDLKVTVDNVDLYIECTTYHKSFGLEEFISELFNCINPDIQVTHTLFCIYSLPKNKEIENFLDDLFKPYLDPSFLTNKMEEVQRKSPLLLNELPEINNFYVYLENDKIDENNYDLANKLYMTGDPEEYLKVAFNEILNNKADSNSLSTSRPNLLMVNFLLGDDWQIARSLRVPPEPNLCDKFDGVLFTACGIDCLPTLKDSISNIRNGHPLEPLIKSVFNRQIVNEE